MNTRPLKRAFLFRNLQETVSRVFGHTAQRYLDVWEEKLRSKDRWTTVRVRPETVAALSAMAEAHERNTGKKISNADVLSLVASEGFAEVVRKWHQFSKT